MTEERKEFEKWAANEVAKATLDDGVPKELATSIAAAYGFACQLQQWKEETGQGLGFLRYYLNELLDHRILTPIVDKEDEWELVYGLDSAVEVPGNTTLSLYQAKRYRNLLKHIKADQSIEYTDTARCLTIDIEDANNKMYMGLTRAVLDKMCPIELPYQPDKPFKAYVETAGDCTGILYFRSPEEKMIKVGRYFKGYPEQSNMEEITREQFETEKNKEDNKSE